LARDWLKEFFFKVEWNIVYEIVEDLPYILPEICLDEVYDGFNTVLEREMSAYRFVLGELTPISNSAEIEAIEDAIGQSEKAGLIGAQQHLKAALGLLGKKPEPDYRNAIKEAISAVESVAKQISGKDKATLGPALEELSKHVEIHPSFKEALKKLYGYTNDEGGIRHAILKEKDIGFDEAKFMIVACSAFVNFLISKTDKAKLLK
jgi:AbiJ N-terminal domain 4